MAVVDLEDVKDYLRITVDTYDALLPDHISSAEAVIAARCGHLEPTERTERVLGGQRLVLSSTPVAELTSVTPADGAALTLSDLYLNEGAGLVENNSGASFTARYYTVVYDAGRATCPEDLILAVKELVRHTWDGSQRGARGVVSAQNETAPGAAYLLPFRVSELIAPHVQAGLA